MMKSKSLILILSLMLMCCSAVQNLTGTSTSNGALTGSGTIEARQVNIAPEIGGRIMQIGVEQGKTLNAGDLLIKLDDASLQAQLDQAKAAVQTAQANYDLLAAGPTAEQLRQVQAAVQIAEANYNRTITSTRQSDVVAAQAALNAAYAAYQKVKDGPQKADFAAAEAALHNAEAALRLAQANYDRMNAANPASIAASPQALSLEQATNNYNAAKATYDKLSQPADNAQLAAAWQQVQLTRANLDKAQNPARDFDVNQAQAQLDQAKAQLDALKVGARPEQLAVAKSQISAAQAQAKAIEVQLAKLTLKSPVNGVVLARNVDVGELATPGAVAYSIGRLDALELTVYLPEEKFALVALGQKANVHVDAYAGRTFEATVLRIADQAEFTPRNVQTIEGRKGTVYGVRLSIPNPELLLKPGMPADVTFVK